MSSEEQIGEERSRRRRGRGGRLLWGVLLILVGAWFLLESLGIDLPDMEQLWPIFPFMGGLAFLVSFATASKRDPGLVWPGTFGVLIGLFFFAFSFDLVGWHEMGTLWPFYPLIVGLSFVATWLAGKCRDHSLLVPGTITLLVGVVGLGMTLGIIRLGTLQVAWPLALVVVGLVMIVRSLRR